MNTANTPDRLTQTARVLIIEDDQALCCQVEQALVDAGYQVCSCHNTLEAIHIMDTWRADLVITELAIYNAKENQLLANLRAQIMPPAFIIIAVIEHLHQVVECLQAGADDFLIKPLDIDHLHFSVKRTLETHRLRQRLLDMQAMVGEDSFHGIISRSSVMQSLFSAARRMAQGEGSVLIQGESGTGKELIARAIHAESRRRHAPFVAVNCAGVPAELLESEFFGHIAGAFTGANQTRKGLFVEADGGSLLLDEIAEMPASLQAKLLRILQDGCVRAVGSDQEQCIDVRIIAATHQNLEQAVKEGRFREDLFFRLETFVLELPPLRTRQDDIELLALRFTRHFAAQLAKPVLGIHANALRILCNYPFPGNVRELINAIERAVTFCVGEQIIPDDLPERIRTHALGNTDDLGVTVPITQDILLQGELPTLKELERRYLHYVLDQVGGNKQQAARLLDIGRATLYRKLHHE